MPLSEADLVQRLQARDARAMTDFYASYYAGLYAVVLRIVHQAVSAEDVLQESMVKIWQFIATYDPAKSRLFTWAARVCANTAIDYVRSSSHRNAGRTGSLENAELTRQAAPTSFRPEHIGVADLLRRLPPKHQQVMEMIYLRGHTQVETAQALNLPLGTVKTWSLRAVELLGVLKEQVA